MLVTILCCSKPLNSTFPLPHFLLPPPPPCFSPFCAAPKLYTLPSPLPAPPPPHACNHLCCSKTLHPTFPTPCSPPHACHHFVLLKTLHLPSPLPAPPHACHHFVLLQNSTPYLPHSLLPSHACHHFVLLQNSTPYLPHSLLPPMLVTILCCSKNSTPYLPHSLLPPPCLSPFCAAPKLYTLPSPLPAPPPMLVTILCCSKTLHPTFPPPLLPPPCLSPFCAAPKLYTYLPHSLLSPLYACHHFVLLQNSTPYLSHSCFPPPPLCLLPFCAAPKLYTLPSPLPAPPPMLVTILCCSKTLHPTFPTPCSPHACHHFVLLQNSTPYLPHSLLPPPCLSPFCAAPKLYTLPSPLPAPHPPPCLSPFCAAPKTLHPTFPTPCSPPPCLSPFCAAPKLYTLPSPLPALPPPPFMLVTILCCSKTLHSPFPTPCSPPPPLYACHHFVLLQNSSPSLPHSLLSPPLPLRLSPPFCAAHKTLHFPFPFPSSLLPPPHRRIPGYVTGDYPKSGINFLLGIPCKLVCLLKRHHHKQSQSHDLAFTTFVYLYKCFCWKQTEKNSDLYSQYDTGILYCE